MSKRTFIKLLAFIPWCGLASAKPTKVISPPAVVKLTVVDEWFWYSNVGHFWRGLKWNDGTTTFTCLDDNTTK